MAEGLGILLKNKLTKGSLKGLALHSNPPHTYQEFVDDNLLFGHLLVQESQCISKVLNTFSEASRTIINLEKS